MHPRNRYKLKRPDFRELSLKYPDILGRYVYESKSKQWCINFQDPLAIRSLTKALLKDDFNIHYFDLPESSLCPTIPNRLNYLLIIEDLLKEYNTSANISSCKILGIDIGTGASCIYPILGTRLHHNWEFIGTDISQESLDNANVIIERNSLADKIELHLSKPRNETPNNHVEIPWALIEKRHSKESETPICFLMCNPPFYTPEKDVKEPKQMKKRPPKSSTPARHNEMYSAGGEVEFCRSIIDQSIEHAKCYDNPSINLYTLMLGHKSSSSSLKLYLSELELKEQGTIRLKHKVNSMKLSSERNATKRWILSWTAAKI